MAKQRSVSVTDEIHAPAKEVYAILADYHNHHPRILPGNFFTHLEVEEGGIGAGTIVQAEMKVFGRKQRFRMRVTEPEPGRMLSETDLDTGLVTTFTVTPVDAERCTVNFTTTWQARPGIQGWLEGLTMPSFLRNVYREELQKLDRYAQAEVAGLPSEL